METRLVALGQQDYTHRMRARRPHKTRIVVAMSGGVDSSVTAALMKREGHDVVGVTLQLYSETSSKKKGACCAGQDIYDARRVASQIDIPHYVLDFEARFRERVIKDFAETYTRGETPVPCVRCNERVKFADLMEIAREIGGDALATGHYVRRLEGPGGPEMHVAADAKRDQSYFLFATTPDQLGYLRFPLGAMEKNAVRTVAAELGLRVATKPDSQDICFVPDGDYAKVVTRLKPEASAPGEVVDQGGNVLARHDGVVHFTVGQRRGLGLSGNEKPFFVVGIDASERRVVVGPREALAVRAVQLRGVNWLAAPRTEIACSVKVRSTRPPVPAQVTPIGDRSARVELHEPEHGVAPGQACVFYEGSRVLGGGWIAHDAEQRAVA